MAQMTRSRSERRNSEGTRALTLTIILSHDQRCDDTNLHNIAVCFKPWHTFIKSDDTNVTKKTTDKRVVQQQV